MQIENYLNYLYKPMFLAQQLLCILKFFIASNEEFLKSYIKFILNNTFKCGFRLGLHHIIEMFLVLKSPLKNFEIYICMSIKEN